MPTTEQDHKAERVMALYDGQRVVFELQQGTRVWELWADDYGTEQEFRAAVENELASLEVMGERLGRGFTCTPIRTEIGETGRYHTVAWRFQDAFVPAARVNMAGEITDPVNGLGEVDPPEEVAAAAA